MEENDRLALGVALSNVPGVGISTARKLMGHFGNLHSIFSAKESDLSQVGGLSQRSKDVILSKNGFDLAKRQVEEVIDDGGHVTLFTDSEYPYRLALCHDAPLVIFSKGVRAWNAQRIVAVVGMRQASDYGKRLCSDLVKGLKSSNAIIVSGLAFGIDIHAHRAALEVGLPTMACLAHGLDLVYPRLHKKEAVKMQESGALVTEYPFGTNPDRMNFPSRNRIIAGLADVTLVVQSEVKGGSMITAKIAHSYNRDVMAVPGNVLDKRSAGCHELIQFQLASLVTKADDLLRFMNWKPKDKAQIEMFHDLNDQEEKIFSLLKRDVSIHIDQLSPKSKLTRGEVMSSLLSLELKGLITVQPGSSFVRS